MSAGAWTVVAAFIALAGTVAVAVGGIITARGSRKASPYEALAERVLKLEEQHTEDEAKRAEDRTKIAGLERRIVAVMDDRDAVVRYVTTIIEWVNGGSRPPAPAVPVHLQGTIPAWVKADDAHSAVD